MPRALQRTLGLALAVAVLVGNSAPHAAGRDRAPRREEVTAADDDNGRRIDLARGDVLVVRLASQTGTGYGWRVAHLDTRNLTQLDSSTERAADGSEGGKEFQVFRFKARSRGSSRLRLHYVRPWQKNARPLKTFELTVSVGRS